MKIVKPSYKIITPIDSESILLHLERCTRIAYKSENKIAQGSAVKILRSILRKGHESVIEHFTVSVDFVCDRGISHELVRHRIASFTQESTRYCNYSSDRFNSEITVVEPLFFAIGTDAYETWLSACYKSEEMYFRLLGIGYTPQEARCVLPNSLKTELVMTANLREWRHFFKLRCAPTAHPQMRELAVPLMCEMSEKIPVIFDDIVTKSEEMDNDFSI